MPAVDLPADVGEGLLLPFLGQHMQQLFQEGGGIFVDSIMVPVLLIVGKRKGIRIIVPIVITAGGHPVAEHFYYIAGRHGHSLKPLGGVQSHIDPVFKMMAVTSLVVEPGRGIAMSLLG